MSATELKPCQKGEDSHHFVPKRTGTNATGEPIWEQVCLYCKTPMLEAKANDGQQSQSS